MKKIAKRFRAMLCVLLVAILSAGLFAGTDASALTINDSGDVEMIDVTWQRPLEILNVETQEKQFILSTKTDQNRINNLYFSFPEQGGVRFHADNTGFWNPEQSSDIAYSTDGAAYVMEANGTKVKVYRTAAPWRFEVYNAADEMVIWYQGDQLQFGYDEDGQLRKIKVAQEVGKDEKLYGLGERFGGFLQNGKTVEMWNFDSFSQLIRSYGDHNVGYVNVPLLHSNHGFTVFHNNNYYGIVDVADSKKDECSFEFYGPVLDMYVWTGSTTENLDSYCKLTGKAATVPKYALSYIPAQATQMWVKNGDEPEAVYNTVKEVIEKYEKLGTPIKLVHLESIGSDSKYSDLHNYLNSKGIKFMGWQDSTYRTFEDNEEYTVESLEKKLGFTAATAPLVKWDFARFSNYYTSGDGANFVDYSDPNATVWLKERLTKFMKPGMIGMMVDYNDAMTYETYYPHADASGNVMHNLSQYYYAKAVYDTLESYYGEGNFMNTVRAGCAGTQSFGPLIAGDNSSTFLGIQESVSALLSSASTSYSLWATDIGGLGHASDEKKNDPEIYARWLQLGTFTPIMRSHGQSSWRHPWAYSESSVDIFQKYFWTRESLVDMLNSSMIRANVENYPMTKPMIMAYPEQTNLAGNESQYLFCDNLLVVPVTESGATAVNVQFPKGRWVSLWDGTVFEGDSEQNVNAPLETIPVFLEAGSAFPVTLGEELEIDGINTEDKNVNALMVAPAVEKKANKVYLDNETTESYICDTLGEHRYSVTAEQNCDKRIVAVKGCIADSVKLGGAELKKLNTRPTSASTNPGFYCDLENNTTLIVTDENWTSLEYTGTSKKYKNVALGAEVNTTGLREKQEKAAQNVTDGDSTTGLSLPKSKKTSVTLDLKKSYNLNKILVEWGSAYARSFKLEVSNSMNDDAKWVNVYEKKKGGGGTDTARLDGKESYRYIRITDLDTTSKTGAELVEIEAYADIIIDDAVVRPVADTVVGTKNGIENSDFIWWITGGIAAVILLGGAVTLIVILKKKKNEKEKGK